MSAAAKQAVGKVGQAASNAAKGSGPGAPGTPEGRNALKKGARRDPELYILGGIMSGAFALAGWYFGGKQTSISSEANVGIAHSSMPWQTESDGGDGKENFKYKYHPGGDPKKQPKDAPSALHSVVVPNVNLPKSLHDQFNKWGKDGY
ncbi:MAG: hypothetical protein M1833_006035 [Piccolia ochrophora]|nr:MAG: hypothetical protein M1833_006035 [Piccolia ochrophora]